MSDRQTKNIKWPKYVIILFSFIAVFASFIANNKPLVCQYKNHTYVPLLSDNLLRQINPEQPLITVNYDWAIYPLIPYSGKTLDDANSQFVSPLQSQHIKSIYYRHWLGTDALGHDVLAIIVHGTTTAAFIAIIVMSITCLLGLTVGLLAGYFSDMQLKINLLALLLILSLIYLITFNIWSNTHAIFASVSAAFTFISFVIISLLFIKIITKKTSTKFSIVYSPDIWLNRIIEFISVLPVLIILIVVSASWGVSLIQSIIIISLFNWTSIAKIIRAETLKIKQQQYIESAKALGLSNQHIILRHILPNVLPTLWVSIVIGLADTVLLESMLTFLGLGVEPEQTTWGSLLASGRTAPSAWWLIVFPGLSLFLVSYSLKRLVK